MDRTKFKSYLVAKGFTATPYNSNNAWGFGGVTGTMFRKGFIKVLIGQASSRHQGTSQVLTITMGLKRVQDSSYSKDSLDKAQGFIEEFFTMPQAQQFEQAYGTTFDERYIPVPKTEWDLIDDRQGFFLVDAQFEEKETDDGFENLLTFPDGSTLIIHIQV